MRNNSYVRNLIILIFIQFLFIFCLEIKLNECQKETSYNYSMVCQLRSKNVKLENKILYDSIMFEKKIGDIRKSNIESVKQIEELKEKIKKSDECIRDLQNTVLKLKNARSRSYKSNDISNTIKNYLLSKGYSKATTAGILANIMAECGGQTLNISPYLGKDYYGICQWNSTYYPDVYEKDINYQLNYLHDTIPKIFGDKYDTFMSIDDPAESALYFAKYYERCSSESYSVRQRNAAIAFDYVNE